MRNILLILLLFAMKISFTQDVHFSQNFANKMHYMPSEIGYLGDYDYRFSIQRRSQWESVSIPFSTTSISFEKSKIYKGVNLGVQFLNDISGASKMTLNQINLGISKGFDFNQINTFSLGLIIGINQKSINYENLIFEQNEVLMLEKFMYSDIGLGVSFQANKERVLRYNIGFSSYHLNNPNNSFNEDKDVYLPLRHNLNFGVNYRYRKNLILNSELTIINQGAQTEILIGIRPEIKSMKVSFFPFAYCRINDAAIFGCGLLKDNIEANITYDINTSDLVTASKNKGGFEFSIIYMWKKKDRKVEVKEKICPKYL